MPDVPIEAGGEHDYPADMEARVRVLEEIAAGTKAILAEIRSDQRAMRAEMTGGLAAVRSEMTTGFAAVRAEMIAMEQRRERDFRIAFGGLITASLGLAYLIAHTAHWL
jgi:hypothetical protein